MIRQNRVVSKITNFCCTEAFGNSSSSIIYLYSESSSRQLSPNPWIRRSAGREMKKKTGVGGGGKELSTQIPMHAAFVLKF